MKRLIRTPLWSLVLVAIMSVSLLACGTSAPTPASSPSSSASKPSQSAQSSSAPASSPAAKAEDAEWQKVIDAAKKEGKAVFYGTFSEPQQKPLVDAFVKSYPGIQLEFVNLRGAEALAKVRAEQAAKQYIADVIYGGGPTVRETAKAGMTLEFVPPEVKKTGIKWLVDPLGDSKDLGGNLDMITNVTPYHILINTNLVKPADEPKAFKDLADPKYKGKIAFDDPRMDGPGNRAFSLLYKQYGEDWIKRFIGNDLTIVRDYYEDPKRVARGEYAILIMPTATMVDPVLDQGLPIKLLNPEEGNPLLANIIGVLKNAPHPNVSKLFVNWMLTPEGQAALAVGGQTPIRDGVPAKRPDFDISGKKAFPGTPTNFETETVYFKDMAQKAKQMMGD